MNPNFRIYDRHIEQNSVCVTQYSTSDLFIIALHEFSLNYRKMKFKYRKTFDDFVDSL